MNEAPSVRQIITWSGLPLGHHKIHLYCMTILNMGNLPIIVKRLTTGTVQARTGVFSLNVSHLLRDKISERAGREDRS